MPSYSWSKDRLLNPLGDLFEPGMATLEVGRPRHGKLGVRS